MFLVINYYICSEHVNITDEEKQKLKRYSFVGGSGASDSNRPFLDMVLASMDCVENDYLALLALCLVYALANNKGIVPDGCVKIN